MITFPPIILNIKLLTSLLRRGKGIADLSSIAWEKPLYAKMMCRDVTCDYLSAHLLDCYSRSVRQFFLDRSDARGLRFGSIDLMKASKMNKHFPLCHRRFKTRLPNCSSAPIRNDDVDYT